MNNLNELEKNYEISEYEENDTIQEMAYLVVTPDQVGLTHSINDLNLILAHYSNLPNSMIKILTGETKWLVALAHKVLAVDNLAAMENGQFQFPELPAMGGYTTERLSTVLLS